MENNKEKRLDHLLKSIDIQNRIIKDSHNFDDNTKTTFFNYSNQLKEVIQGKLTQTQIKSISKEFLVFWNEGIGPEVEAFWAELKDIGLEFERRDELEFALKNKRFRRVDQGIAAKKHWNDLKSTPNIIERFSADEISVISEVVSKDEESRHAILKKCLEKNSIPKTQYLKFGECMAYFSNCGLFEKYFRDEEIKTLYSIWNNFPNQ